MPQVLTLTRKPEETVEEFAARISAQMGKFFGQPVSANADTPTDVPAAATDETADEEPAPSP
jgi:hypothetical protein